VADERRSRPRIVLVVVVGRGRQIVAYGRPPFIHLGLVALKRRFLFAHRANHPGVASLALDVAFTVTEAALELQFGQAGGDFFHERHRVFN